MADLNFLKKTDLFKGLSDEQLALMEKCSQKARFKRGEKLFAEGDDSTHLWVVVEGQVDLSFDLPGRDAAAPNIVSAIPPTKTFGWSSFVPPFKCRVSAYCSSATCSVLRFDKESLLRLFEQDNHMGYVVISNLAGVISTRFHRLQKSAAAPAYGKVIITVHMGTCGISAGAREVMNALRNEISEAARLDIQVKAAGCIGKCTTEPNVTVQVGGEGAVVYQKMTPEKMRQVFQGHIIQGKIQQNLILE